MPERTPITFSFKQKPQQAIDYLNSKGYQISFNYKDIKTNVHKKAFTVAKATRVDLLNDIFTSLDEAMKNGTRFEDWKQQLKPTLQKKGWWGETEVTDPRTGETKNIYVGSRRLRTIFRTNMRVAYHVGRHDKQAKLTQSVYWQYISKNLPNRREKHAQLNNTVLHRDNDWWKINYPPNGWNCRCYVKAIKQSEASKKGLTITEGTPPNIASKDWMGNPALGTNVGKVSKIKLEDMNLPRGLKPNKDLDNLSEEQIKQRFYKKMGTKEGEMFIDAIGDPMIIDDSLFTAFDGSSKLKKRERHRVIDELANTIAEPDEIWIERQGLKSGDKRLVKKMIRFHKHGESNKGTMAVFEYNKDKTQGVSIYHIDTTKSTESKRSGKKIY